ncbi:CAP domain-containing protein [Actinoplanes sp. NEAU-A12]|uniref:CAP domain-containing protein n=1 Tax=Actinoplanes sandaracinus TaxID=3045177 RepID=A0ABT6WZN6_9ACTN|nr:CAP domain-containing protein [Actinoplanes sandaracinus]MDI6105220.1 CAP domain-containing protein [Actinoplanes sandaracinus]
MRQLLRRLAVTALLAPVAAIGATTMIASPAEAVPAESGLSHPGPWNNGSSQPGSWKNGLSHPGSWKNGLSQPGSWWNGSWKPGPAKRGPSWPIPAQPTTPAPAKPAPTTPVPVTPAPTKPAPAAPAPTTSTPGNSTEQALQTEINRLINVQRSSNGCAALTVNEQLTAAARSHSAWMAQTGTFSHTGSGGSTFVTRVKAAGYAQPSAENIAMGYRTAAEVVDGWMNSSGHRTNILNCQSKAVGVGVVHAADGSPYYTQNFGY